MKVATETEKAIVGPLVAHFKANDRLVKTFLKQVLVQFNESENLAALIHSMKHRAKDPAHLADKLLRKIRECAENNQDFDITTENLFTKINDLAGIRILHLHTSQIGSIDAELKSIINEQGLDLIEGPIAKTWDDEYRAHFKSLGIETEKSESLYTSVHYVVASKSKTIITCEIQVRTLMEEVWGEVNHSINYPHPNEHVSCREQIRALARTTSATTRLVDSIFATIAALPESLAQEAADEADGGKKPT